jgi:hypothetical protein
VKAKRFRKIKTTSFYVEPILAPSAPREIAPEVPKPVV